MYGVSLKALVGKFKTPICNEWIHSPIHQAKLSIFIVSWLSVTGFHAFLAFSWMDLYNYLSIFLCKKHATSDD
jgi:hypothetical protein